MKQMALLKWFVRKSYVNLPGQAVKRYAVAVYDKINGAPDTRGTPRRSAGPTRPRPPRSGHDIGAAATLDGHRSVPEGG